MEKDGEGHGLKGDGHTEVGCGENDEWKEGKMGKVGEEHEGNKDNKCVVVKARQKLASYSCCSSSCCSTSNMCCGDCVSSRLAATRPYAPKFLKTFQDKLIMVKQNCRPSVSSC